MAGSAGGPAPRVAPHVLAAVRARNRLELVRETLRHALDTVAVAAPDWLRALAPPEWGERDHRRRDEYRLPTGQATRQVLAHQIGIDGVAVLQAVTVPGAPPALRALPAVEALRQIWVQHDRHTAETIRFRTTDAGIPPAARFLSSPHDLDAQLAKPGASCWIGYKVALTETCDDAAPELITHVETVAAPVADGEMTLRIQQARKEQHLLPAVHLVDTGFLDAELLVDSQGEYGVELLGPTRMILRWHARAAAGFGVADFVIAWDERRAVCPAGHASVEWVPRLDSRGAPSIYRRFSKTDCGPCPCRADCTHASDRQPLGERPPHQDAHSVPLGDGKGLALDAAVEDRVRRLLGAEPLQAAPLGNPLGLDDVGGGHRGRADRADFATVDQLRERATRLLNVGVGVRPVELVEVDVVRLQAAQRVLDRGRDSAPGRTLLVGVLAHRAAHFGGQDDVVAQGGACGGDAGRLLTHQLPGVSPGSARAAGAATWREAASRAWICWSTVSQLSTPAGGAGHPGAGVSRNTASTSCAVIGVPGASSVAMSILPTLVPSPGSVLAAMHP